MHLDTAPPESKMHIPCAVDRRPLRIDKYLAETFALPAARSIERKYNLAAIATKLDEDILFAKVQMKDGVPANDSQAACLRREEIMATGISVNELSQAAHAFFSLSQWAPDATQVEFEFNPKSFSHLLDQALRDKLEIPQNGKSVGSRGVAMWIERGMAYVGVQLLDLSTLKAHRTVSMVALGNHQGILTAQIIANRLDKALLLWKDFDSLTMVKRAAAFLKNFSRPSLDSRFGAIDEFQNEPTTSTTAARPRG